MPTYPQTIAEFDAFKATMGTPAAFFAIGFATLSVTGWKDDGRGSEETKFRYRDDPQGFLDAWYPIVNTGQKSGGTYAVLAKVVGHTQAVNVGSYLLTEQRINEALAYFRAYRGDPPGTHPNIDLLRRAQRLLANSKMQNGYTPRRVPIVTFIRDPQSAPLGMEDAYLRLHATSMRLAKPNEINVDAIFKVLPNVVWTNLGPFNVDTWEAIHTELRLRGVEVSVRSQDKFPYLLDYVALPSTVRIADSARVRLGAYLSPGTTVMQYGFVNYNAGTLGSAMVEGRIPQGVVVGNGTDVGAGAGIEGTLSGGGTQIISIGEGCMLGALSETGISLGKTCAVQAGVALHGTRPVWEIDRVEVKPGEWEWQRTKKVFKHAAELSGRSNMCFWNGHDGGLEVFLGYTKDAHLNPLLHN